MKRTLPVLFMAPVILAAQPASLPDALTAHLAQFSVLHLDFQQVRTLAALTRPLKSTGSLVVSKSQGVIWQVKKPLAITYVVGPKGLQEVDGAGKVKRRSAKDVPAVAQIGRIFQSLLQGKWSALDDYFTVKGEGRADRWTITLVPKPQVASFLKGVRVSGGRFIERVHVDEPGGDTMDLTFLNVRTDLPVSPMETRLYSFE